MTFEHSKNSKSYIFTLHVFIWNKQIEDRYDSWSIVCQFGGEITFYRMNFYQTLENVEVSGKSSTNHFLILITFLCTS